MAKKVKKANALNSSNRSITNRAAPNYNLINKSNKLKKIAKKRQWNWKKSMNYRPFGFNQRNLFNNAYNNQNVASNQQQSMPTTSSNQPSTNSEFRHIIIDGSNVAFTHGHGQTYSSRGIQLAVEYFIRRGHSEIKALVPRFRRSDPLTRNPEALDDLEQRGFLVYTPSRYLNGKLIAPYDDRFILDAALYYNAVIVSNDNYMDLKVEKPDWQILVDTSLLQFMFVGDLFMVAIDPMGRNGPSLDEFLKNQNQNQIQNQIQNQNPNPNQNQNQNSNQNQIQNQNQNQNKKPNPNQNQNKNQNSNQNQNHNQNKNQIQNQNQDQNQNNRPKKKQKVNPDENQCEEVLKHLDKEDLVAYRANRTPLLPNPPVIPRLMENQLIETPKKVDKNVPVVDLTQSPIKAPGPQDLAKKQQQTDNQKTSSKRNVTLKTEIVRKPFNQIDNNNNNQQDRVVTMNN